MTEANGNSAATSPEVPCELRSFATLRGRPAIFVILHQEIQPDHLLAVRNQLGNKRFAELDFVIHSGGGNIHTAYQIAQIIHAHTDRMTACVPLYAKSAATLWCIAANNIVMDESAELGPLDTQVREQRSGGKLEYVSSLNPSKTLEQLRDFSLETLDHAMKLIFTRYRLSLSECLEHSTRFVQATTGALFGKLDPEKLGAYSRALTIGSEYGERLLSKSTDWGEARRKRVLDKLVRGYPSHDHIIDAPEMKEIGFPVTFFPDREREAVGTLLKWILSGNQAIRLVEPSARPQDAAIDSNLSDPKPESTASGTEGAT